MVKDIWTIEEVDTQDIPSVNGEFTYNIYVIVKTQDGVIIRIPQETLEDFGLDSKRIDMTDRLEVEYEDIVKSSEFTLKCIRLL